MMIAQDKPIGQCFYCAAPIHAWHLAYVCATPFGLVRVCRTHAKGNTLARLMKPGDVVVDANDIRGWKSGR